MFVCLCDNFTFRLQVLTLLKNNVSLKSQIFSNSSLSSVIIRFVEPIDRTSYKQWSSACPHVTQTDCSDEATPSGSDSDISNNQTAETSAETEDTQQLSFAEVMRLVQEGKEVPGAKKLDVKPTNQNPTPSAMERRLKPWETPK